MHLHVIIQVEEGGGGEREGGRERRRSVGFPYLVVYGASTILDVVPICQYIQYLTIPAQLNGVALPCLWRRRSVFRMGGD